MQRLPRLVFERVAWRLPVTDVAAGALLAAVSADAADPSERSGSTPSGYPDSTFTGRLEATLVRDPLLSTWFALRAREFENVTFGCLRDLVTWLNRDRLLAQLQWTDASDAAPLPADGTTLELWRWLADGRSRFLCSPQQAATDRAFYRRCLSYGAKWFGSCCQRPGDLNDSQRLDRIANRFAELGASVMPGDIRSTVMQRTAETSLQSGDCEWSNRQLVAPLLPGLLTQRRRLMALENDFTGRLELEKLEAMKELAYGASHEINNPLANISARAQTLLVDENDPGRRRKLAAINRQAFRAHDMIADMMLFAKPPRLNPQPVQISTIVDDVLRSLNDRLIECRVRVEQEIDGALPEIDADPTQLSVALRAILENSIQAIQEDGTITVSADVKGVRPNRRAVTIRVRDSGPGIPEQTRLHIFDPFFSGREAGRGLGFGLSKAWRIVQQHGGRLEVENVPGSGTVFTMHVPSQVG